MPVTVRNHLDLALKQLGVLPEGGRSTDGQAADALSVFLILVDSMNADRLNIATTTRRTYTWTANQASRTIGPSGAQLAGPRPLWVDRFSVIPAGGTTEAFPAKPPMTRRDYDEIVDKARTATVFTDLLYEPTETSGTYRVYPVPTTAPTLVTYEPVAFDTAVTLDTPITFRPGVAAVTLLTLMKWLCSPFKQKWSRENAELLRGAEIRLARLHTRVEARRNDPVLTGTGRAFDMDRGY